MDATEKRRLEALEAWERIERILTMTDQTAGALARRIGLLRGENLYRIKRGHNRISFDVAERIHACYPVFSEYWILTGRGPILDPHYDVLADDLDFQTAIKVCLQMLEVLRGIGVYSALQSEAVIPQPPRAEG